VIAPVTAAKCLQNYNKAKRETLNAERLMQNPPWRASENGDIKKEL
jgi:hypothetical protein